ncbi:unnamed protein product [Calicophoron daubneyi]|uniref:Thioredoxin n=1 Tax=Calicophoron daubneyi TaxID=300641 RepID=A0AAV2TS76_CALDB
MREIKTEEELEQLLRESEKRLVILDFFAEWCGPCKKAMPVFHTIAEANEEILCVKVNVDESEGIAGNFEINGLPTFILLKGGVEVEQFMGPNLDPLRAAIEKYK